MSVAWISMQDHSLTIVLYLYSPYLYSISLFFIKIILSLLICSTKLLGSFLCRNEITGVFHEKAEEASDKFSKLFQEISEIKKWTSCFCSTWSLLIYIR